MIYLLQVWDAPTLALVHKRNPKLVLNGLEMN